MLTSQQLRDRFINFYQQRGHREIAQASLVPVQDTSVLFTTAGMHPLIPYLLGDKHPDGQRLVNVQRSLRTTDIEEVGDATHSTVFEMLGHWSLGDYFKQEAIEWSYQFVTQVLGFDEQKIATTIFKGNKKMGIALDKEAELIWKGLGVSRIAYLGQDDNWWGPVHATGPCGPTTEIFVHIAEGNCSLTCLPGSKTDSHWVEIWNNVFLEYFKTTTGTYEPLKQKNIDTGVGLERVLMTVNSLDSIYQIDLYEPIIKAISLDQTADADRDIRIIADHVKAAVFMIADGVLPSNKDRGYILRRLIRRAVGAQHRLGKSVDWRLIIEAVIGVYSSYYSQLLDPSIDKVFVAEQIKFNGQLDKAINYLEKTLKQKTNIDPVEAVQKAFLVYQSHALPLEIGYELLLTKGVKIDREQFDQIIDRLLVIHKQRSSKGQVKKFGGHGLILDTGELKAANEEELKKVTRLHTATHILQAALRQVLGDYVQQRGSDINAERLRFDFTHPAKLTNEEKSQVEEWANAVVQKALPMQWVELPLEQAKKSGALHFFTHKYPPKVKVYFVGNSLETAISKEFCGGPHVTNTKIVGKIRIIKEESVSAGIRRIKATVD